MNPPWSLRGVLAPLHVVRVTQGRPCTSEAKFTCFGVRDTRRTPKNRQSRFTCCSSFFFDRVELFRG